MEFVVVLLVIIVLCKVLGVSNGMLMLGGLGLIVLIIIAMFLFFTYFCLQMLFSKRKKGRFSRIGKPEKSKFNVAYYIIDDVEYPCIFPKESLSGKHIYNAERECTLLYSKLLKKVFDIWAVATCIIGMFFSAFSVLFALQVITRLAEMEM